MSMSVNHYVGFYFKCPKMDDVDQESLFPDESMFLVFDEGGSKDINDCNIYIPNQKCPGCFSLDKYSDTGLLDFGSIDDLPDLIIKADSILRSVYEMVEMRYGVVSYVH